MFQVNLVMDDETGEDMDSRKERQALEDAANAARQALEDAERSFQAISDRQLTGLIEDGADSTERTCPVLTPAAECGLRAHTMRAAAILRHLRCRSPAPGLTTARARRRTQRFQIHERPPEGDS